MKDDKNFICMYRGLVWPGVCPLCWKEDKSEKKKRYIKMHDVKSRAECKEKFEMKV